MENQTNTPLNRGTKAALFLQTRTAGLSSILRVVLLLAVVAPLRADPEISIAPAVEISWESLPNKLYQVMASDSVAAPVWSEVGAPVLGTGAEVRRMLLRGDG